jgi:hypothetical protein
LFFEASERFLVAYHAYRVGCKTKRNSGFYLCRQDADTRNEHQDDGVSHKGLVRMTLQEGFRMKQRGYAGCVMDTSRKENESRSGWSVGQDGQDVSG